VADLPPPLDDAVFVALGVLESDALAGKPLQGRLRGIRSLRVGSWRIPYTLADGGATVVVRTVSHRSSAYRADPR
jgi:mRNA interferase RelE/StbE